MKQAETSMRCIYNDKDRNFGHAALFHPRNENLRPSLSVAGVYGDRRKEERNL